LAFSAFRTKEVHTCTIPSCTFPGTAWHGMAWTLAFDICINCIKHMIPTTQRELPDFVFTKTSSRNQVIS